MIVIGGLAAGAVTGFVLAARRGGSPTDRLHYAAAYAIAFGLVATLLSITLARLA
jgi:hypothetical protein